MLSRIFRVLLLLGATLFTLSILGMFIDIILNPMKETPSDLLFNMFGLGGFLMLLYVIYWVIFDMPWSDFVQMLKDFING